MERPSTLLPVGRCSLDFLLHLYCCCIVSCATGKLQESSVLMGIYKKCRLCTFLSGSTRPSSSVSPKTAIPRPLPMPCTLAEKRLLYVVRPLALSSHLRLLSDLSSKPIFLTAASLETERFIEGLPFLFTRLHLSTSPPVEPIGRYHLRRPSTWLS